MKYLLRLFLVLFSFVGMAQEEYPKEYFLFPIKPNQQNFLAGTMGEIRSNHFHAGIDIKTDQRIGLPVYAAADGYISRINISPFGYGNAMYIQHPSGHTTVYAHLENFDKRMDSVMISLQYQQQTFAINQYFPKNLYKVQKGDIIAYSGNTGGSMGPHLHFEIRDKNQHVLNPLSFGFDEIKDNTNPIIKQLSLTTFNENSHIKNQFGSFFFKTSKINSSNYKIIRTIPVYGKIGISLKTVDLLDGASNKNGVNLMVVKVDSSEVFRFHNTIFSFSKKLHMNQHIDYCAYKNGKGHFQKCYLDEGNKLSGYSINKDKGMLVIKDSLLHNVEIAIFDGYNNKSKLQFKLQGKPLENKHKALAGSYEKITHEVSDNILKITVQHKNTVYNPKLFIKGKKNELKATYQFAGKSIYLWNLKKGVPDSLTTPHGTYPFHFLQMIPSPNSFDFYHKNFNISFPKQCLFDTLYLEMEKKDDVFDFKNTKTPFGKYFNIVLKPNTPIDNYAKTHVYEKKGNYLSFIGGSWKHNHIQFRSRTLGKYVLSTDTIPPRISYLGKRNYEVSFRIKDKKSGIKSFNAYINGQWLLMKYDYKRNMIWSDRLDKSVPLKGKLKLEVVDEANNKKIYTLKL